MKKRGEEEEEEEKEEEKEEGDYREQEREHREGSQYKPKCMRLLTWEKGHFNLIYLGTKTFSYRQCSLHLK